MSSSSSSVHPGRLAFRDTLRALNVHAQHLPLGKLIALQQRRFAFLRGRIEAANVLVLNDRPAVDDDRVGLPFADAREGGLMRRLYTEATGRDMDETCLTLNCVSLRPPGHREPNALELHAYVAYVRRVLLEMPERQIQLVVCLGRTATTLMTHGLDVHLMYGRPPTYQFTADDVLPSLIRAEEGTLSECTVGKRNFYMVNMEHPRDLLYSKRNDLTYDPARHALTDRMKAWHKRLRSVMLTLQQREHLIERGVDLALRQPSAQPFDLQEIDEAQRLTDEPDRFMTHQRLRAEIETAGPSEAHPFVRARPAYPPRLLRDDDTPSHFDACLDEYAYCADTNQIRMYLTTPDNYSVVVRLRGTQFHMWVDPHPCITEVTGVSDLQAPNYCSRLEGEIREHIRNQLAKPYTAKNVQCPRSHLYGSDVRIRCVLEEDNRVNNEGFQPQGRTMIRIEVSHYLLLSDVYRTLLDMLRLYKDNATERGDYQAKRLVVCDHAFKPTEKLSYQYGIKASHWLRFPREHLQFQSLSEGGGCNTQIEADFTGPEHILCLRPSDEVPLDPAYPELLDDRARALVVPHSGQHPQTIITSLDTEWVGMTGGFPNSLCDPITTISLTNHHKHCNTRYLSYYGYIPEEGYQKVNFQLGPFDETLVEDGDPPEPKAPGQEGWKKERYYDKALDESNKPDAPAKMRARYEEQLRQWPIYRRFCRSRSTNFQFACERELLQCWAQYMLYVNPDTICGHNVKNFDLKMILDRMRVLNVPIRSLGRNPDRCLRVDTRKFVSRAFGERIITELQGLEGWCLADTLEIFLREKKYTSYSLNYCAEVNLKDRKDEVPYTALPGLWRGSDADRAKVVKYCRRDAHLCDQLMNVCAWGENMVEFARINGTKTRNDNYVVGQQIKVLSAAQHVNRELNLKIRFEHSRAAARRHNEEVIESYLANDEGAEGHLVDADMSDIQRTMDAMVIDEAEGVTDVPETELARRKQVEEERLAKIARESHQIDLSSLWRIQMRVKALEKLMANVSLDNDDVEAHDDDTVEAHDDEEEEEEKLPAASSSSSSEMTDDQQEKRPLGGWVPPEQRRREAAKRKREPLTEEQELCRQARRRKAIEDAKLPARERAQRARAQQRLQQMRSQFMIRDHMLVHRDLVDKQLVLDDGTLYTFTERDLSILTRPMSELVEAWEQEKRDRARARAAATVSGDHGDDEGSALARERSTLLEDIRELERRLKIKQEGSVLSRVNAAYQGATVMPPVPGLHYRFPVICVDFASLYPSIMMRYNISPDTILFESDFERLRLPDGRQVTADMCHRAPITGPNPWTKRVEQVYFIKKKYWHGLLPLMEDTLLKARKGAKRWMAYYDVSIEEPYGSDNWIPNANHDPVQYTVFNGRQLQIKIVCNSGYGAMGANGMLANKLCAAAVTAWGRAAIELVRDILIERYNAECVGGDTDSVFMIFPGFPKDHPKHGTADDIRIETVPQAEAFSSQLEEFINAHFKLPMKIEYEKAMFPMLIPGGKKRYCGIIHEKGKPGRFFSKGMETVRRDSLPFTKDTMKRVFSTILKVCERDETFEQYDREIKRRKLECVQVIQERCMQLLDGDVPMTDLIMSKQMSRAVYEMGTRGAHLTVRDKKIARGEPPPKLGERIAFMFVQLPHDPKRPGLVRKGYELAEDPEYVIRHDLPINYAHYLDKKFVKPVLRVMRPVLREDALAAIMRRHTVRTLTGQKRRTIDVQDISERMITDEVECMLFKRARKGTAQYRNVQTRYMDRRAISQPSLRAEYSDMAQYTHRIGEATPEQRIDALKRRHRNDDPHQAFAQEQALLQQYEERYRGCLKTCQECLRTEEVLCANTDCRSYYPRVLNGSKSEQQRAIVQQLSVDIENLHLIVPASSSSSSSTSSSTAAVVFASDDSPPERQQNKTSGRSGSKQRRTKTAPAVATSSSSIRSFFQPVAASKKT